MKISKNKIHNEFEKIYKYLCKDENSVIYISETSEEREDLQSISSFIQNIFLYNKPDFYNIIDNRLLMIEHFEFDSSINVKGSQFRHLEQKINDDITKRIEQEKKPFYYTYQMELHCNKNQFIENAIKFFSKHYMKIKIYKEHLFKDGILKDSMSIETCFFIEDVSPLGNIYVNKGKPNHLNLLLIKQFLDIMENSYDLDYIFYGAYVGIEYKLWFMSRQKIEYYRKLQVDIDEVEFFPINNPLISGCIVNFEESEVAK